MAGQTVPIQTVVFDLGGVLLDWDPKYLYLKMFKGGIPAMDYFLENICTMEWNIQQDAGRTFQEGVALLTEQYPEYREFIEAYDSRWEEMQPGPKEDTLKLLEQLKATKIPLYALTNFSKEKFAFTFARYEFLQWFDGIVVSGDVKLIKPDLKIYQLLLEKYEIEGRRRPHR